MIDRSTTKFAVKALNRQCTRYSFVELVLTEDNCKFKVYSKVTGLHKIVDTFAEAREFALDINRKYKEVEEVSRKYLNERPAQT